MEPEILFFFNRHPDALPLYLRLEEEIVSRIPDIHIRAGKTQISFSNRYNFAFASFLPVRKAADRPQTFLTVSFGHFRRVESPRIDAASEPYPNRWIHHVMISAPSEIDDELMLWICEAAEFSAAKGRKNV